jgi:hypothetical protein
MEEELAQWIETQRQNCGVYSRKYDNEKDKHRKQKAGAKVHDRSANSIWRAQSIHELDNCAQSMHRSQNASTGILEI